MVVATLTLNPSLDVSARVERVVPDDKLRAERPRREPGGGGVNVARAILRLGGDAVAVHTRGGAAGSTLVKLLAEADVEAHPVEVGGNTRENITFLETTTEQQFRFVMPGPELTADEWERCREAATTLEPRPAWMVLSGSLPPGLADDTYAVLADDLRAQGVRVAVDTSGPALQAAVDAGVDLVKPNVGELARLLGRDLDDDRVLADAVGEVVGDGGVGAIVVSLGAGGAYVAGRDVEGRHLRSPTVTIRSKVGAGDSMVAGMVLALSRGWDLADAAQFGVAAGAAAVMTPGSELCRREDTERLYEQLSGNA